LSNRAWHNCTNIYVIIYINFFFDPCVHENSIFYLVRWTGYVRCEMTASLSTGSKLSQFLEVPGRKRDNNWKL